VEVAPAIYTLAASGCMLIAFRTSFQHFHPPVILGVSPTSGRRAASTNLRRKAITAAAKMATNSTRSNLGEVGFYPQGQPAENGGFRENLKTKIPEK